MPTNRKLRAALLEKLDITPQALSLRVQKKIHQLAMSTTEATYVIAHENGIKLHKYLAPAEVETIRQLQAQLRQTSSAPAPTTPAPKRRPTSSGPRLLRIANKINVTSTMLTASKLAEAKSMAELYPILYILENSMREVIRRVMRANFGDKWWDTRLVSGKLKSIHETAAGRMKTDETKRRWHQGRGDHPIDYVNLEHLGQIILGHQTIFFPTILGCKIEWFKESFMEELEPSRNVLCHMNPLSETNARDLLTRLERWEAMVQAAGAAIPAS